MKLKTLNLSTTEKLGLISNLSTMLAAGIPIIETIDSLLEDSKGNNKKLLESLRADLEQGNHVSTSFAKFPEVFNKVTVNLIKAAEEAGTLDVTLKDLKENIKKDTEFKDKIKAALTYPMLIIVVFVGMLLMILTVVVPKISTVFLRLNVELPLPTQLLIFLSNIIVKQTVPFLLATTIIGVAMFFLLKKQKKFFLRYLFAIPVVSPLIKEIDLTRFSRSMYLLLNAGIPISSAMELAQEVVMKDDISQALKRSNEVVLSGKKLSEGLKEAREIIPSIMIKIIEAGEKSGTLDRSMQDISEYLDYQVAKSLSTVTAMLEPIMLIFVGVLVGGMMLAIIAPIYGLIGSVGAR